MKTGQAELMTVLDEERAVAVIEHRQKIRKPMTAYAAKLLAKRLSQCPDPAAAADYMIEKGWQSIEPDWLPKPKPDPHFTEYQRWANESKQRAGDFADVQIIPADWPDGRRIEHFRNGTRKRH